MYNTDLPRRADLPTSAQLRRSTIIAIASASAILTLVVLPAEYAIDPTGVGRVLGLTQMGEIKRQLAAEADADAQATPAAAPIAAVPSPSPPPPRQELPTRGDAIETLIGASPLPASRFEKSQDEAQVATPDTGAETKAPLATADLSPVTTPPGLSHELSFTLAPGEGAEIKLVMSDGAKANFAWTANGAIVNFDAHGDGGGRSVTYEKGRGVPSDEGVLEAAFDGNHGWFWRNRTDAKITVTLRTSGDYRELKRLL